MRSEAEHRVSKDAPPRCSALLFDLFSRPPVKLDYQSLAADFAAVGYIAEDSLAMAVCLAIGLERPLLLEGEAGVGKTDVGRALAAVLKTRLIRLQCYEGLDANATLYEWNYQRQLLAIRAHERDHLSADAIEQHIFSEAYLLRRPLLEAISQSTSPVLLIDEIDRADEEFEAFLMEILSDFQVTIPELGTLRARSIPRVILTSNGTRASDNVDWYPPDALPSGGYTFIQRAPRPSRRSRRYS